VAETLGDRFEDPRRESLPQREAMRSHRGR
jgi:hypothetical protein